MRGYPALQVLAATITTFLLLAGSSTRVFDIAAARASAAQGDVHAAPLGAPAAALPDWVLTPANANLVIVARHDAAPSEFAFGIADIRVDRPVADVAARYADILRRGGWTVETARFDVSTTEAPRRVVHHCLIEGRRDVRVLRLSLDRDRPRAVGSLLWARNLSGKAIGARPGSC